MDKKRLIKENRWLIFNGLRIEETEDTQEISPAYP